MKRFGTGILVVVAAALVWMIFRQGPRHEAPLRQQAETVIKPAAKSSISNPTPTWAVSYDREFWRKSAATSEQLALSSPAVNVREVIDRVSHAFRATNGANPTVSARDYTASLEGASLHFSQGTNVDLKITTTSAKIAGDEILKPSASTTTTHYIGNTAQTILDPTAGLIQHFEARAQGVELTWILQHRPDTKGALRIEAALDGLTFASESDRAFHFADSTGVSRVRISNATLVDSSGNRAEVPTQIIDSQLVVQVPADLLATAAYPIAIDPLISPEFGMDRPVSSIIGGENAKVASNGADYLVVWHDWRSNRDIDIYAARVSRDGWILDPNGIGIRVGHAGQDKFAVASNGADYLIVWTEYGSQILGARLSSDGTLLDPDAILVYQSRLFPSHLSAAGNGDNYLVLWRDNVDQRNDLYGGVVRASDGHVTDTSGKKLAEERSVNSAAAVARHLGGFVAIWRGSGKTEGAMYRIENGAIAQIAGIQLPSAAGPVTSPAVASGPGGVLVAWEDYSDPPTSKTDIYGQLLSPTGQSISAKFPICTAPYDQNGPVVAANSEGFIIAWQDNRRGEGRETTNDVYYARVANDTTVTPANGQLVTPEPTNDADRQNQTLPDIASNGSQSLIIWTDITPDLMESVRSARIASDGTNIDPRSLPVTVSTLNQQANPAVAANSEGFLVAWVDQRNGSDIYGARFTRDGHILDPGGIAISTARGSQNYLALTSNGSDYFAIWSDSRDYAKNFGFDVYGARISNAGVVIDPNGIPINAGPGYDFYPKAASDGTNYVAVWQRIEQSDNHVYARHVRSNGDPLPSASVQIKGPGADQLFPNIASNGREYIVAWTDGDENYADAYGQRLNHDGALIGGVFLINNAPKRQVAPLIASNGDGYFVTWLEGNYDSSNFDPQSMFGTRLGATGQVLDDPPILVQPASNFYIQRALASDGADYLVLWQIANGSIEGVRISGADSHQLGDRFVVTVASSGLNQPSIAGSDGNYLVAYASSDAAGNFWRVRGRTVEFNLPEAWQEVAVGSVPAPGAAGYKDGVFTIQGSGGTTVGGAFHFVYQTLDGDGQIVARVKNFSTPGEHGRVGVMIRQTRDAGSPYAFIGFNGEHETMFTRRRSEFGDIRSHTAPTDPLPEWFKLIRAGELILAYRSEDGVTWQRFDTTTINFNQRVFIGLAINSGNDAIATAQLDQVSIWRFQAPIDPPAPPTLSIAAQPPTAPADFVTLSLTGNSDMMFQLESSTNLIDWILVQPITTTESAITITAPQNPANSLQFYRLAPAD